MGFPNIIPWCVKAQIKNRLFNPFFYECKGFFVDGRSIPVNGHGDRPPLILRFGRFPFSLQGDDGFTLGDIGQGLMMDTHIRILSDH